MLINAVMKCSVSLVCICLMLTIIPVAFGQVPIPDHIRQLKTNVSDLEKKIGVLQVKIDELHEKMSELDKERNTVRSDMVESKSQLADLQFRLGQILQWQMNGRKSITIRTADLNDPCIKDLQKVLVREFFDEVNIIDITTGQARGVVIEYEDYTPTQLVTTVGDLGCIEKMIGGKERIVARENMDSNPSNITIEVTGR